MQFNPRYTFAHTPIVKLFFPFLTGIFLGIYFNFISTVFATTGCVLAIIVATLLLKTKKIERLVLFSRIKSGLLIGSLILLGYTIASLHEQKQYPLHYAQHLSTKNTIQIRIKEPVVEKERSVKIVAEVLQINDSLNTFQTEGKLLVYLQKNEEALDLNYGDIINAQLRINEISPPLNPHQFDYKNYLRYQNVYHQAYADSLHWELTTAEQGNFFLTKIYKLRHYLHTVIDDYVIGEDEKAVANAILIGNKEFLENDLIRSYSSSGAMHVLAVSGLHVGIIYLILNLSFSFLERNEKLRKFKPFLIIALIWFYALLTGGSPSVLRSATMFSFITIGTSLYRHTNIYNIIAGSAFVLIIFNPYIVTEVGFQLSYFAVTGIIFLQPKIYNFWSPKNWLLDKVWALTAVSCAAQIATFPLGILYFHQFPNLFWISNLVVIPAATFILYIGVLLFIFSWWKFAAVWIGKLLFGIIWLLNQSVSLVDKIPYSLSAGLDISHFQTVLIYVFLISFCVAWAYRQKQLLWLSFCTLLVFSVSFALKINETVSQQQLIVYNVPKTSAIEFINGRKSYSLFDNSLQEDDNQLLFSVKHNWWNKHINEFNFDLTMISHQEFNGNTHIHFQEKNILLIDSNYQRPISEQVTDYVIISHNPKLYLETFTKDFKAHKYIFDSSNPNWKIKYWQKDCESLNLDCYFVTDNFAYMEEL